MQKLSEKKIQIIHRSGQSVSATSTPKKGFSFFGFFSTTKAETRGKNTTLVIKAPILKKPAMNVPKVNPVALSKWVALEEKIVHDYKEQKTVQFKSPVPSPKTPVKQPEVRNLPRADLTVVKSWVALEEKIVHDYKEQKKEQFKSPVPSSKTPVKQPEVRNVPRADISAVKGWGALEEKIGHDYKEKNKVQFKSPVPSPITPMTQPPQAFVTFSTQTAVSSPLRAPKLKDPFLDSQKTFSILDKFLLLLGMLAVGASVFLFVQGGQPKQGVSPRLAQLQSEKELLGRSYAELKNASEDQDSEMQWLSSQLHDATVELKKSKDNKVAFEQGLEKKYREELMRITIRYESEIASLRGTVQTQKAIVSALKAQGQAFEKILDQAGISALSGAAAGFSQEPFSAGGTFARQGEVLSVNERQGFAVINVGSSHGARSGRSVAISRSGIRLAVGRLDRVYPTTSTVGFPNAGMLQGIQEGDSISFS